MIEDITTRLRRDCMSLIADEAADEIERLRDELSARNAYEYCKTLTELRHRIETLTAERDEARREVCQKHDHGYFTDEDYAEIRGWDCFKENTNDR